MIIGIFSDTHDNKINIAKAYDIFKERGVEKAYFCGDLVSPFTLNYLKDWPFAIKAVFGNNEGDKWGIQRRFEKYHITNIEYAEKSGLVFKEEIEGQKIAVFHGHSEEITEALIDSQKYDLVCTGHTHQPHIKKIGKTIWINPGSVTGISEDPSVKNGSVAIYNSETKEAEIIYIQ
jgi:putative phosphoesterase